MEETPLERRRRLARERKRRERARRSPSKVAAARAADALAKEEKRKRIREINAYERYMRQQNLLSLQNMRPPAIIRKDGSTSLDDNWDTQVATGTSQSFLRSDDLFPKPQKKNPIRRRHRASAKSVKLQENHDFQLKTMVVPNHQHFVMSNLSSLWKNKMLCDAGIGNGTSTIKVHKVVLSAICPKLLSVFNTDISSQKFLQVNFPEEVTEEALNAFAEYMYDGILNLNRDILKQLKIIAKRLDMKSFEQLCDIYLPNDLPQLTDTLVDKPNPVTTSSSASIKSMPSFTAQIINVKQEISGIELDQVKKETATTFGQESDMASLDSSEVGNNACIVICSSTKTEPVEPDGSKYGHLSSSNQVFKSTTSSSSLTSTSATSVTSSSTTTTSSSSAAELLLPFSQTTDVKFTRLKPTHSYESSLVPDSSSVPHIDETICSQSSPMTDEEFSKLLLTSSLQLSSTRVVESVSQTLDPNS